MLNYIRFHSITKTHKLIKRLLASSIAWITKDISNSIPAIIKSSVQPSKCGSFRGQKYWVPWDVAEFLYPALSQFDWPDDSSTNSFPLGESLIGHHMASKYPVLRKWVDDMAVHLRRCDEKTDWWGDLDVYVTLVCDTEERVAFHVRNTCTCADISEWLVIMEVTEFSRQIHVREVQSNKHDNDGNEVDADNLGEYFEPKKIKFWKNRGYAMKGDGIYGDIRDAGFVISHNESQWRSDGNTPDVDSIAHSYNNWVHFMGQVSWTSHNK